MSWAILFPPLVAMLPGFFRSRMPPVALVFWWGALSASWLCPLLQLQRPWSQTHVAYLLGMGQSLKRRRYRSASFVLYASLWFWPLCGPLCFLVSGCHYFPLWNRRSNLSKCHRPCWGSVWGMYRPQLTRRIVLEVLWVLVPPKLSSRCCVLQGIHCVGVFICPIAAVLPMWFVHSLTITACRPSSFWYGVVHRGIPVPYSLVSSLVRRFLRIFLWRSCCVSGIITHSGISSGGCPFSWFLSECARKVSRSGELVCACQYTCSSLPFRVNGAKPKLSIAAVTVTDPCPIIHIALALLQVLPAMSGLRFCLRLFLDWCVSLELEVVTRLLVGQFSFWSIESSVSPYSRGYCVAFPVLSPVPRFGLAICWSKCCNAEAYRNWSASFLLVGGQL